VWSGPTAPKPLQEHRYRVPDPHASQDSLKRHHPPQRAALRRLWLRARYEITIDSEIVQHRLRLPDIAAGESGPSSPG
jgi:hypothetical protein